MLIPHLSASNVGRRLIIGAAVVGAVGVTVVVLLNIIGFCGLVEGVGETGEVGGGGAVGEIGTVVPSGPNVGGPFGACVGLVGWALELMDEKMNWDEPVVVVLEDDELELEEEPPNTNDGQHTFASDPSYPPWK